MTAPVPDWVTAGPDVDGNYEGPDLVPTTTPMTPSIAWVAPGEPMLWVDTALYDGRPLTNREAIQIAAGLLQGALLVGGPL